jgi:hypothetical protein
MERYSHFSGRALTRSTRAHHDADGFFDDLVGTSSGLAYEAMEDAPTITLSPAEVLVCVGGINNATVTATTTGGGTVAWSIADPTRASITASGNTATIRGRHPGVTTVRAELRSGSTTVVATARLLVTFIQLTLRNSGTIEPAPENEDEAADRASAGGTSALGPLPMGDGRRDAPGEAYTAPIMMIGRIFPAESATRFTFRWQRLLTRRAWRMHRDPAGPRWTVTQEASRGPLVDDTDAGDFNDATPSTPGRRIYIYDCSALNIDMRTDPAVIGDFLHEKKDFIYRVFVQLNGVWTLASATHVGQVITARRRATTRTVASDWVGVENSNEIRRLTTTISEAEVRAIVGGTDPITLAPGANT